MATTKSQTKAAPATEAEAKPESSKVRAKDVQEDVLTAIQKAGPEGISLKDLEKATGLRYRVLHNVVWTLGENPKLDTPRIKRVGEGRKLVFASVEAKPDRKPRARKPAASKSTAKATSKAA
jgi:hypothetical protein